LGARQSFAVERWLAIGNRARLWRAAKPTFVGWVLNLRRQVLLLLLRLAVAGLQKLMDTRLF